MCYAEQLTVINNRYFTTLRRASKFPPAGVRGASGIRRDRIEAKAHRERRAAMAGLYNSVYTR